MKKVTVNPAKAIKGVIEVPGDKSISHRAVMLGSIAKGATEVKNFLMGEDCLSTINAFKEMGISINQKPKTKNQKSESIIVVEGKGLRGLKKPKKDLYLGNSGTTMRLIMGILSGQDFECVLTGDESLSKRPMKRVAEPLSLMGAVINSENRKPKTDNRKPITDNRDIYPPLVIKGSYPLRAIQYKSPIASAQVKSAILLAGLYAKGNTQVWEPLKSRDHTERMLEYYGASIKVDGLKVSVNESVLESKGEIFVPGDISSAAFFMVAALILKSSEVTIKNLGVNPTRTGIIDILKRMGAKIEISNLKGEGFEPMADVTVSSSDLKGITIEGTDIPRAIDELPVLMVAAVFSKGTTIIKGAAELRVKETDRISSMKENLEKMGANINVKGDDIIIEGTDMLRGAEELLSYGDHRTAMSMYVAGLRAKGKTTVLNTDCITTSFPDFTALFQSVK